jgi:type II secretory pathway component GspD/PulD (secretin)
MPETPAQQAQESVRLEFREQMWLPALEWLAGKLKLNLDWRKLPEGTFNLHSEKTYTIEEAEDLLNMQLLARGFTLLKRGEVLRIEQLEGIDITLVPRVEPDVLSTLPKHSIARVSFPLESMLAEEAATDLKPLLSPFGKMHAFVAANRLEVMDAVVNLREIHRLVSTSDAGQGKRQRVLEIKIVNRKAIDIAPMVRQLLGMPPDGLPNASTQAQLDIEQTRLRAEAVKQLGGNAKEMLSQKKPEVFLVVNEKENSILVQAPPEKMEIARQAIESLDKELPPSESVWETINKVKVYSVSGYDPATIAKLLASLQEIGNLSKDTRIQHDATQQRIIAVAGADDQLTISRLIEQFRGEKRSAHVLPLSGVEAEYAVNALKLVLKPTERFMSGADGKFEVEADPVRERMILWATTKEVAEVREFLAQLGGTIETAASDSSRFQVVHLRGAPFDVVAEQFRQVWTDLGDAPLVIQPKLQPNDLETPPAKGDSLNPPQAPPDRTDSSEHTQANNGEIFASTAAPAQSQPPAGAKPSVRLIEGKNGEMVIVSRDPKLAASAKRLLEQLTPADDDVRIITLRHAQAQSVKTHIDQVMPSLRKTSTSRLDPVSPAPTIQVDARLNRLVVQHCNVDQWEVIDQIVAVLDVAADNDELERQQIVHRLRYRRAADVAKALKDAYKDVMEERSRAASAATQTGFSRGLAASSRNPEYQGLLSIGVDDEANLLIISAPTYMVDEVLEIVQSMDTRQDSKSVAVVPLSRGGKPATSKEISTALDSILKATRGKK